MSRTESEIRNYFRNLYKSPEKHYVRIHGWLSAARERLNRVREGRHGRDFASYFTFPGEFAVDVLLFAENGIIEETSVGFPGVVYCETRSEILSEISKKLGRCKGILPYSFERAVFSRSFQRYCPFDIINLDLTKEVFPRNGRPESNTIRALKKLFELHNSCSFDLYITFKSSIRETNRDAVDEFIRMIDDNFQNNDDLRDSFVSSSGMEPDELLRSDFTLFWCKSFPKWILEQGLARNVSGNFVEGFYYQRRPPRGAPYDIITFLFSFKRPRRTLMAEHELLNQTQNEIRRSFSYSPIRVDNLLANDNEESDRLAADVERILLKPPKTAA